MAWNSDPTCRITLHFRDDDGANSQHIINVPANDFAVAGFFATAYASLFPPLSNCALWKVTLSLRYLDTADPPAVSGSTINRRSVFVFGTEAGERLTSSLPGVGSGIVLEPPDTYAGVGLDTTGNVAVAALVSAYTTGLGGVQPCAPWGPGMPAGDFTWPGSDIVELLGAYWGYERAGR